MLKMHFNPGKVEFPARRVSVEPPYEKVADYLRSESDSVAASATNANRIRAIIKGEHPPLEYETGNMWTVDIDPDWATLTNEYAWSKPSVRLPTAWLLDAIERWREFLLSIGRDPEV